MDRPLENQSAPNGSSAEAAVQQGSDEMAQTTTYRSNLPVLFQAPELNNETWLNTDQPLHLADLRGKVVGVEMWTFDCINCQHVMPHLKELHNTYSVQGFVLIGNHFPEFSFEADVENVKAAIARFELPYAVAIDNDGETWRAYGNHAWPTIYLIDKWGNVRYSHVGEGKYNEIATNVGDLLAETYP
jgi:thiol-disulfide isomerase/thioredoxin